MRDVLIHIIKRKKKEKTWHNLLVCSIIFYDQGVHPNLLVMQCEFDQEIGPSWPNRESRLIILLAQVHSDS